MGWYQPTDDPDKVLFQFLEYGKRSEKFDSSIGFIMRCPSCYKAELEVTGVLGKYVFVRCRHCGKHCYV